MLNRVGLQVVAVVIALGLSGVTLAAPGVFFRVSSKKLPTNELTYSVKNKNIYASEFSLRVVAGASIADNRIKGSGLLEKINSVQLVSGGQSTKFTRAENPNADKALFSLQALSKKGPLDELKASKRISFYLTGSFAMAPKAKDKKRAVFSVDSESIEGLEISAADEVIFDITIDAVHTGGSEPPYPDITMVVLKNKNPAQIHSHSEKTSYSAYSDSE